MMRVIYGSLTLRGFLVGDFADEWEAARAELRHHYESGAIVYRDDLRAGFDLLPTHFCDLFNGRNNGTLIVTTGAATEEVRQ